MIRDNNYGSTGASHWTSTFNISEVKWEEQLEIAPLPFTNRLIISQSFPSEKTSVALYNILGMQVKKVEATKAREIVIETSDLPRGVFIISITNQKGEAVTKQFRKI